MYMEHCEGPRLGLLHSFTWICACLAKRIERPSHGGGKWKAYAEGGAATKRLSTAPYTYAPTVPVDNLFRESEPQPVTLIILRCEEWLEETRQVIFRDTMTVI